MSDQNMRMIAHSLVLSAQRGVFAHFYFHHAQEIYHSYPVIAPQRNCSIIHAFTKICLMSVHNMFTSDQTFINQPCERLYIFL